MGQEASAGLPVYSIPDLQGMPQASRTNEVKVLSVRNVHQALPEAIRMLKEQGEYRDSRNGRVVVYPEPVTTVYSHPCERVMYWPQRDANPFLHLYESLWMLSGRQDVAGLSRYTKQFMEYSDDGTILHDAYGYRWRYHFGMDQLNIIVDQLNRDPDDRRAVLQMWDAKSDLGKLGKAYPCNLLATFQRDVSGALHLCVFNRSNDIIWGAYGANAVHFSVLLEYMAHLIGCPVGTYSQISVNWHAYKDVLEKIGHIPPNQGIYGATQDPYSAGYVRPVPLEGDVDNLVHQILAEEPFDKMDLLTKKPKWVHVAKIMLRAHRIWSTLEAPKRFYNSLSLLMYMDPKIDWIAAGLQWIRRRQERWEAKQKEGSDGRS